MCNNFLLLLFFFCIYTVRTTQCIVHTTYRLSALVDLNIAPTNVQTKRLSIFRITHMMHEVNTQKVNVRLN